LLLLLFFRFKINIPYWSKKTLCLFSFNSHFSVSMLFFYYLISNIFLYLFQFYIYYRYITICLSCLNFKIKKMYLPIYSKLFKSFLLLKLLISLYIFIKYYLTLLFSTLSYLHWINLFTLLINLFLIFFCLFFTKYFI